MPATLGAALTAGRFRVVASLLRDFLGPVATVLPRVPAARCGLNMLLLVQLWACFRQIRREDALVLIARNQQLRRRALCL
jgi:hypothetical protein